MGGFPGRGAIPRQALEAGTDPPSSANGSRGQVWRSPRQARLAAFLETIPAHPFDDGQPVGRLLAQAGTSDVVDAHLVICAIRLGHDVLTGDPDDLTRLTAPLGPAAPTVHTWP